MTVLCYVLMILKNIIENVTDLLYYSKCFDFFLGVCGKIYVQILRLTWARSRFGGLVTANNKKLGYQPQNSWSRRTTLISTLKDGNVLMRCSNSHKYKFRTFYKSKIFMMQCQKAKENIIKKEIGWECLRNTWFVDWIEESV